MTGENEKTGFRGDLITLSRSRDLVLEEGRNCSSTGSRVQDQGAEKFHLYVIRAQLPQLYVGCTSSSAEVSLLKC